MCLQLSVPNVKMNIWVILDNIRFHFPLLAENYIHYVLLEIKSYGIQSYPPPIQTAKFTFQQSSFAAYTAINSHVFSTTVSVDPSSQHKHFQNGIKQKDVVRGRDNEGEIWQVLQISYFICFRISIPFSMLVGFTVPVG